MYATIDPGTKLLGLTADDVSTSALAWTGLDLVAGTADDYTVTLVYENDCTQADVRVDFVPIDEEEDALGVCTSAIESFDPSPVNVHHRLVPFTDQFTQLVIEVNVDVDWDLIFAGDSEGGTTLNWDETVQ